MNQIVGTVSPCHHTAVGCCTRETSTGWASLLFKNEEQPSVRLLSWHPNLWHTCCCSQTVCQFASWKRCSSLTCSELCYWKQQIYCTTNYNKSLPSSSRQRLCFTFQETVYLGKDHSLWDNPRLLLSLSELCRCLLRAPVILHLWTLFLVVQKI